MKEMTIRPLQQYDIGEFSHWTMRNEVMNRVDPDITTYPTLNVWLAQNGRHVAYLPVHSVLMLESLAPNPNATDLELVQAIAQLVKHVIAASWGSGAREIWFHGTDPRVNRIAERHGFERVTGDMFRLKVETK